MSRRSIYRAGRTNTSAYGPKTESRVQHWRYDYIELATTREDESEGTQKGNTFKVKTWIKIDDSEFKPLEDADPEEKIELVNRTQQAADEIANKDVSVGPTGSETPDTAAATPKDDQRITEVDDEDSEMKDSVEPEEVSVEPEEKSVEPEEN